MITAVRKLSLLGPIRVLGQVWVVHQTEFEFNIYYVKPVLYALPTYI